MKTIAYAVLPILSLLLLGYVLGRLLPVTLRAILGKLISPLVWSMLFVIGTEFGGAVSTTGALGRTLLIALVFALLTTLVPMLLVFATRPSVARKRMGVEPEPRHMAIWSPVRECVIALFMVSVGFLVAPAYAGSLASTAALSPTALLYVLIFLVGVDIVGVDLKGKWISITTLQIPVLVVTGSLLGGIAGSFFMSIPIATALALSSGFGWFTLSGVLVGEHLGKTYGAIALLTDLFRELFAIVLLYVWGSRHPRECIAAGGATVLDSTLPVVKQTCGVPNLFIALTSGLTLTLLAPFLITFFVTK